jgi:hypothetical protein
MREIQKLPALTSKNPRLPILLGIALSLIVCLADSGCKYRRTVKYEVPQKIILAKTATFEELLGILKSYEKMIDLTVRLDITLTRGKKESGELKEYRGFPGYIQLRRPDSTHLVVQNPVSKSAELEVLSVGDELSLFIHDKQKLYRGSNSAKELFSEELQSGIPRGSHIFEAILPQSINMDSPGFRISMEEEVDSSAKYYVLSILKEGIPPRIHTMRKIWIERSELVIARQQIFLEDGQVISDIEYSNMEQVDGFFLPLNIRIDRPLDEYALNLELKSKSWRINQGLSANIFVLNLPKDVQVIPLKEKTRSDAN